MDSLTDSPGMQTHMYFEKNGAGFEMSQEPASFLTFPTVNSFRLKCRGKDLEKKKAREPWKNGSKTDFYLGKNSESPECMYIQKQAYIHSSLC